MPREESQEGHAPGVRAGDKGIKAFRNKSDSSMRIGMQMREDMRQDLCRRSKLENVSSYYWRLHDAPFGKSSSRTPPEGTSKRLITLKPSAFFGVGGVIAFSYSEMR